MYVSGWRKEGEVEGGAAVSSETVPPEIKKRNYLEIPEEGGDG